MDISIVIPLYNEEESLGELYAWIAKVMHANNYSYEVIFMNDGSTDNSWGVIQELAKEHENVKGIRFRKNQGKSNALNVGFKHTQGDVVITMDADLQDSPDEIPELYNLIMKDGYDLISGWKQKRYDPITKTLPTKLFNWATRKISKIQLHDFNCGLKSYRSDVVKSITVYGEMHRYIPFLAKNVGYNKIGEKVVEHQARKYGVTKFGLDRFINGFLDLATLAMISKFGRRPMHFFGLLGTLMFFISIVALAVIGGLKMYALSIGDKAALVTDNPWFYIMLTTTIIGTQLFLIGFLAEIVLRQSNKEPNYTITEKLNIAE
ncbi:MAG: glycosyltransferase family 2 protein [Schleiferiaceae bacterium]|nr:glycosyltransferase family 2 protein [Schleiferiaceae bacterium]